MAPAAWLRVLAAIAGSGLCEEAKTCEAGRCKTRPFNQPRGGNQMPRAGGPGTFMRLPMVDLSEFEAAEALEKVRERELDVCIMGIPMDSGTSWRAGARFGPRQIRQESSMMRPYNMATKVSPFDWLQVADCGDIAINTFHVEKSCDIITDWYKTRILPADVTPIAMGGDHTVALPILRAMASKYGNGTVGLVHVDAHADVNEHMFGERIAHGTPFRRAVEENLLDPTRVVQIGLRGTGYAAEDFDWGRSIGFRVVQAEELWYKSLVPLMEEVRAKLGDGPVYLSFDIDSLDPGLAPGTGTPEVGGITTVQALEIIRGLRGLNLIGADLVEVSPPYDQSGTTALMAANFLYEMLGVLPRVQRA